MARYVTQTGEFDLSVTMAGAWKDSEIGRRILSKGNHPTGALLASPAFTMRSLRLNTATAAIISPAVPRLPAKLGL